MNQLPAVTQTVWPIYDPAVERLAGDPEGALWRVDAYDKGLVTRGPRVSLDSGMYGVEVQLTPPRELINPETRIAAVQITAGAGSLVLLDMWITAGAINQTFGGMYGGVRFNLVLNQPMQDVEFRVYSLGVTEFGIRGFKLIPRTGRVWFPRHLLHTPEVWTHHPDRSATSSEATTVSVPPMNLEPGDYRVGIKLKPPRGMEAGQVALLDAVSGDRVLAPETVVTAQDLLANFGIPDAKLRFRLAQAEQGVEIRLRTLVEGVTLQWARLATADEAVWHHYYNLGGLDSVLGAPTGDFTSTGESPHGLSGSVRAFERGAIFWTVPHGPCEVYGPASEHHQAQGGIAGLLGYPTSRPKPANQVDASWVQTFEGGTLAW